MADYFSMIVLAIVQGIAEWFPISSSGHLVLASKLLGYTNTLGFDVALHFGTLMAVFVYFGKDITDIVRDFFSGKFNSDNGKMGIYLIIATIPAAALGYLFNGFFEKNLNDLHLLTAGFSITAVLLIISSLDLPSIKRSELTMKTALLIGLAQCASLFRGISRSGSTICAGVLLGLDQRKAARFSFLMSIPIIFGANFLSFGGKTIPPSYLIPALVSFVVGLVTIHVLLKFVLTSKKNLRWFGIYVLLVAASLMVYLLLR
jgi:undecaprenyl-diphosphatase